jgi:thioredoxin-related protein
MKHIIIALLFVCQLFAITAKDAAWVLDAQPSLQKALKRAEAEHKKMVVLVVVKDGCGWCEKMVHETLSDKSVRQKLSDDAVVAVIDLYSPQAEKLGAMYTPTIYFWDVKGNKPVQTSLGFEKAGAFLIDIVSAMEKID